METAGQPETDIHTPSESTEDYAPAVLSNIKDRDTLGLYLDDITKTPLLEGNEAEAEISKRIEAGLYASHVLLNKKRIRKQQREELEWIAEDGVQAKEEFLKANLRLVVSLAKKHNYLDAPLMDKIQIGNIGLIRAIEKFDYQKGYKFSTYATWWIKQFIGREAPNEPRLVYLPAGISQDIDKIRKATRKFDGQGITATHEMLAVETDVSVERVRDLLDWQKEHISLETPIGHDGDGTIGDMIASESFTEVRALSPEDVTRLEKLNATMQEVLTDREYLALGHLYGLIDGRVLTYRDLTKVFGISNERVRQIVREATRKILAKYAPEPDTLA